VDLAVHHDPSATPAIRTRLRLPGTTRPRFALPGAQRAPRPPQSLQALSPHRVGLPPEWPSPSAARHHRTLCGTGRLERRNQHTGPIVAQADEPHPHGAVCSVAGRTNRTGPSTTAASGFSLRDGYSGRMPRNPRPQIQRPDRDQGRSYNPNRSLVGASLLATQRQPPHRPFSARSRPEVAPTTPQPPPALAPLTPNRAQPRCT
jgi:hypothetical protein